MLIALIAPHYPGFTEYQLLKLAFNLGILTLHRMIESFNQGKPLEQLPIPPSDEDE
jgi:hypothetical protein